MLTLRGSLRAAAGLGACALADAQARVPYADLAAGSNLALPPDAFRGRSVLLATARQLPTALALVALDGLARRLVLAPPDLAGAALAAVLREAEIDRVVVEAGRAPPAGLDGVDLCAASDAPRPADWPEGATETEWVLATSGTTGAPKLVVHTLAGLAGGINTAAAPEPGTVWGTFYDVRRYGGLQVYLRALLGPSSLVLSDPEEAVGAHLERLARSGATHVLGTPSHWRRALMSPALAGLAPRYARLSGEIADQPILDRLAAAFPGARVAHAYASTEAGVGFSVEDGLEGFPADLVGARPGIEIAVRDGTLRVRSHRTGRRYLGGVPEPLVGPDGFVDTGDRVERCGERYRFLGRRSGLINVGGAKVQPEVVEAALNRHPRVSTARVRARPSPILGSLVVAEVVPHGEPPAEAERAALAAEILAGCRRELPAHMVPARLTFVPALPLTASGKLVRDAP